ncbi:hypothetical protein M3Y94_00348100 [Aphelenchoides besseyi]|nr:hypothetical protein M3Y94_00348100 [Aphelenchoides besseyi]
MPVTTRSTSCRLDRVCVRWVFCPTEKQLATYTKQWSNPSSRITIEEFKPIYGALKKEDHPATYDQMVSCLGNFEREQEGYIMEADLRHVLENLGERLNSNETEGVLKHIEFVNGKARISEIADLLLGKNEL